MNIPFICVGVAFLLIYLSKIPLGIAMARQAEGYDNKFPRDQQNRLSGWGKRALGAHLNSIEAFAPFAAAVIISHISQANPVWTTRLALAFIVARVVYLALYLANLDKLRSLVWFVGILATAGLFILPWV